MSHSITQKNITTTINEPAASNEALKNAYAPSVEYDRVGLID